MKRIFMRDAPADVHSRKRMNAAYYAARGRISPVDQHILIRKHYIEGSGQLCEACYNEVYLRKAGES